MILYKLDTKGKLRSLEIIAIGRYLKQTSGLVNGKKTAHTKEISEKNIGKANYQTQEEACISQAESLIKKKLREGYYESEDKARSTIMIKPMLAENYADFKHKIDYETAYIQTKLDGMRCYTELDGEGGVIMKSRGHKILSSPESSTLKHIEDELKRYRGMPVIIDGELYAHGFDLQENMKMLKKFRPGETDVHIKYHIYDTISEHPTHIRCKQTGFFSEFVVSVNTIRVYNEEDIERHHKEFLDGGHEGSIIRYGNQGYEMKRTQKLLKKKDFEDITAEIIGVLPQKADPTMGKFRVISMEGPHKGTEFTCSYNGTQEEQRDLLVHPADYIGQTAEIRFCGYHQDGIPKIAKVITFRLDK